MSEINQHDADESGIRFLAEIFVKDKTHTELIDHIVEYSLEKRKRMAATIKLAEAFRKAYDNLLDDDFEQFCRIAGVWEDVPRHILYAVGKNAAKLRGHVDSLPSHWEGLYKLARMPETEFQLLVDHGYLTPWFGAADASRASYSDFSIRDDAEEVVDELGRRTSTEIEIAEGTISVCFLRRRKSRQTTVNES